jgi:hypothetical protein
MKKLTLFLSIIMCLSSLFIFGCKEPEDVYVTKKPVVELIEGKTYSNQIGTYNNDGVETEPRFNTDLFYRTKLMQTAADPYVLYCDDKTDAENYGRYFLWGTTWAGSYNCFSSRDCVSWEACYASYVWAPDGWEADQGYAPEVIYDGDADPSDYDLEDDGIGKGVYFMFYTADPAEQYRYYTDRTKNSTTIGLAVSVSPYGPYKMWNGVEKGATIGGVNYAEAENFAKYTDYYGQDLQEVSYHGRRDGEVTNDDQWLNHSAIRASLQFQYANRQSAGQVVDGTLVNEAAAYMLTDEGDSGLKFLDAHAFVDPVTKEKYLYIVRQYFGTKSVVDENGEDLFAGFYIYGFKMKDNDWAQIDYSTATRLTRAHYTFTSQAAADAYNEQASSFDPTPFKDGVKETKTYSQGKCSIDLDPIGMNEGPTLIYNENTGLYYLTISSGNYPANTYCVIQLVAYSPLGPFRKLDADEGGLVLSVDNTQVSDIITGVGHHSITKAGDELLIVYHRHNDISVDVHNRYPATDRLVWVKNNLGMTVLHANGPTSSIQPKFYGNGSTEYDIISDDATATVSGSGHNSPSLLNDNVISTLRSELEPHVKEFEFTDDSVVITLTFSSYREITALMIYNSRDYYKTFYEIKKIELDFIKDGVEGVAVINNLLFDWKGNEQYNGSKMRAGGSAVAVFNPLMIKEVRITVDNINKADGFSGVTAISEIYLLGKPNA